MKRLKEDVEINYLIEIISNYLEKEQVTIFGCYFYGIKYSTYQIMEEYIN